MSWNEVFTMAAYFLGAGILCLAGIFGFSLVLHVQQQMSKWLPGLLYVLLLLAIGSGPILANRDLKRAATEINMVVGEGTSLVMWSHRTFLLAILAICFARFFSELHRGKRAAGQGGTLYAAFLAFFVTNIVISSFMGTVPVFDHKVIYTLFLFSAVYLTRQHDLDYSIQGAKIGLLVFLLGGLVIAVVVPQIAVQPDYMDGWIPFMRFRLWGLGPHANSLGPLSLVFILLVLHKPFSSKLLQYPALLIGLAVLVLAQSKTVWFAAIIVLGLYVWGRNKSELQTMDMKNSVVRHKRLNFILRSVSGRVLLGILGVVVIAALVVSATSLTKSAAGSAELTSASGRSVIWAAAVKVWESNILFGYGLSAWGVKFREMVDMSFAFTAHNQVLQSLSMAGALGVIGLLIYLVVLGRYSFKANRATKGLSFSLFVLTLIRCYTETPLAIDNIFVTEFVIHLLLFRTALAQIKSGRTAVFRNMQRQLQLA